MKMYDGRCENRGSKIENRVDGSETGEGRVGLMKMCDGSHPVLLLLIVQTDGGLQV
jgi:hypothetical protein